jgi:hypothetical protein
MASERLEQLQKFYDDDPRDPFNIYALALEFLKHDPEKSQALFSILLLDHESYIPTYYHAAKLSEKLGDTDRARRIYEKGMEQCKKNNDTKTLRELRSAYEELMSE